MTDDADRAVEQFNAHLDHLCDATGLELDAAERQRIFGMSVANGFSQQSTVAAFSELLDDDEAEDHEDDYEDDFEPELEPDDSGGELYERDIEIAVREAGAKLGRPLTTAEIERATELLPAQTAIGDRVRPEHVTQALEQAGVKSWGEMTREEVNRTMATRVHEAEGRDPTTGLEPRDEYNLADNQQFAEYVTLRESGAEFDDAEPEPEPPDE